MAIAGHVTGGPPIGKWSFMPSEESVGVFTGVEERHFLWLIRKVFVTRLFDAGKLVPPCPFVAIGQA